MNANRCWLLTLIVLAIIPSTAAQATFHRWRVTEVYSNADGSVQYIELFSAFNGQEFLSGHFIRTQDADSNVINNFIFPSDLASGTAGKTFLLGTQDFSSLNGGVNPDYIIPENFMDLLQLSGQDLNFIDRNFVDLDDLLASPGSALRFDGSSVEPTPVNYLGQAMVVPEPSPAPLLGLGLLCLALRRRAFANSGRR